MIYSDPFNYILSPLVFMPLLNTLVEPVYAIKHSYLEAKFIYHHPFPNAMIADIKILSKTFRIKTAPQDTLSESSSAARFFSTPTVHIFQHISQPKVGYTGNARGAFLDYQSLLMVS